MSSASRNHRIALRLSSTSWLMLLAAACAAAFWSAVATEEVNALYPPTVGLWVRLSPSCAPFPEVRIDGRPVKGAGVVAQGSYAPGEVWVVLDRGLNLLTARKGQRWTSRVVRAREVDSSSYVEIECAPLKIPQWER